MWQRHRTNRFMAAVIALSSIGTGFLSLLSGCSIAEIKEIDPHVSVAPKAMTIAESPTVTTTVPIAKALDFRPQVKMPKGLVQIRTSPITFRPVWDVKPGAFAPTITVIVPKDAFHFEVKPQVDIAAGAIQVGTLEKGAVQMQGVPLWAYMIMGIIGLGGICMLWLVSRVRKHDREISHAE